MRESQMKKLVALAVAGAFIAPVYAAEITISGETEMQYVVTEGSDDRAVNAANEIEVTASDTVNGVKISTSILLDEVAVANLSLAFPNGLKLTMGDAAGALDAVGDYTDVSPEHGGFDLDGNDHSFLVTLPSFNGATFYASFSPAGGGFASSTADATAFGAKYNFGAGEVYVGTEEVGDANLTAMGAKYSAAGFTVAYERGTDDNGTDTDETVTGFSLTYKMGDILLGMERQETKPDGSDSLIDETISFIEYNLGSSVDIYIANETNQVTGTADQTTVGIEYSF
jgi:predicted porin